MLVIIMDVALLSFLILVKCLNYLKKKVQHFFFLPESNINLKRKNEKKMLFFYEDIDYAF